VSSRVFSFDSQLAGIRANNSRVTFFEFEGTSINFLELNKPFADCPPEGSIYESTSLIRLQEVGEADKASIFTVVFNKKAKTLALLEQEDQFRVVEIDKDIM